MSHQNVTSTTMGSPEKLGQQHALFMTRLQTSPSKSNNANNSGTKDNENGNLDKNDTEPNVANSNSSKVIDSLREQIDTLTETNLELTKQSHHLLNKLEIVQINETNLVEELNILKSSNDTINNNLIDSTNKLKYLENQLNQLKSDYSKEINIKKKFEEQIKLLKNDRDENSSENGILMKQTQYDILLSNQEDYKKYYTEKINELNELLTKIKLNYESNEDNKDRIITDKLNEMESLSNRYEILDNNIKEYIQDDKLDYLISQKFDINDWIQLYNNMNEKFYYFANERMELSDVTINKLKHELKTNRNKQSTKTRSVSDSNDSKDKRTTKYYGNLSTLSQDSLNNYSSNISTNNSNIHISSSTSNSGNEESDSSRVPSNGSISMLLPGVKRTSSVRRNPSINLRYNK
ncbi:She3p PWA37_002066 [Arxiozyma heterogenica]